MKTIVAFLALLTLSMTAQASQFNQGDKVQIKDNGWVCRTLEKAVDSRVIAESLRDGLTPDLSGLNNGSCITYSAKPLTIVKYEDYTIPGYADKGRLFVSLKEPRSGDVWYAYQNFLEPAK
jgi:hypothetical protein